VVKQPPAEQDPQRVQRHHALCAAPTVGCDPAIAAGSKLRLGNAWSDLGRPSNTVCGSLGERVCLPGLAGLQRRAPYGRVYAWMRIRVDVTANAKLTLRPVPMVKGTMGRKMSATDASG